MSWVVHTPGGSWIHEFHEIHEIEARSSWAEWFIPPGVMNSWISWNSWNLWNRCPIIMSWVVHTPGGHEFMNFMKFLKSMKSVPDRTNRVVHTPGDHKFMNFMKFMKWVSMLGGYEFMNSWNSWNGCPWPGVIELWISTNSVLMGANKNASFVDTLIPEK